MIVLFDFRELGSAVTGGTCVVSVTTAADTVGAEVVTPENGFASIDPAASVIFRNCVESIFEKGLAPPLPDLAAALRVVLTDVVRSTILFSVLLDANSKRILNFTFTPVESTTSRIDMEERGCGRYVGMYPVIKASGYAPCMLPREDSTAFSNACRTNRLLSNSACVTPRMAWTTGKTTDVTIPVVGYSVGDVVGVPVVG
jgi:hypothetical protein